MPVERVFQSDYTPLTGLTPTWIYYGNYTGTDRKATQAPNWRSFGSTNVYAFVPWLQDRLQGALWVADFGVLAFPRYRWGSIKSDAKAFYLVSGGVAVDSYPTAGTFFTNALGSLSSGAALTKVAGVTGLYVVQEGSLPAQKWSTVGAVSYGTSFGIDNPYNQQIAVWGDGVVQTAADLTVLTQYVSWPSTLPQEPFAEGGVQETSVDNTIRTGTDTGPATVRRRFTGKNADFTFQLFLSPEHHAILEGFYRGTLSETQRFTWVDFKTGLPATYRFKGPPTYEYVASDERANDDNRHWWRASITLEVLS